MYHRVLPADDSRGRFEEPGMIVTPTTFRRHLEWLAPHMKFVRLQEWAMAVRAGRDVPQRACAITFDDGWRDNYEYGFPVLKEKGVPATVFVVSDMVGTRETFWPNRLMGLLSAPGVDVDTAPSLSWLRRICSVPLSSAAEPDSRAMIVAACKQLDEDTLSKRLGEVEAALSVECPEDASMLSWPELTEMVSSGLVDVGSHTRHHVRLVSGLPPALMRTEIVDSRHLLESRLGRPVEVFCYPNGDFTGEAASVVGETYTAAVTTAGGINDSGTPLTELRRIGVHESSTSTRLAFVAHLSGLL